MFMCPIEPQCKFERLILLELARRRACGSHLEPAARKPLTRGFRSEFPIIRVIENGGFGTTGCALGAIRCITMRLRPGSRRPVLRQQHPFDTGRKHEPHPDHAPFSASPPVAGRGARPNWLVFCSARSPHDWGGEVGEPGWSISPTGGVPRCVSTGETPRSSPPSPHPQTTSISSKWKDTRVDCHSSPSARLHSLAHKASSHAVCRGSVVVSEQRGGPSASFDNLATHRSRGEAVEQRVRQGIGGGEMGP